MKRGHMVLVPFTVSPTDSCMRQVDRSHSISIPSIVVNGANSRQISQPMIALAGVSTAFFTSLPLAPTMVVRTELGQGERRRINGRTGLRPPSRRFSSHICLYCIVLTHLAVLLLKHPLNVVAVVSKSAESKLSVSILRVCPSCLCSLYAH